MLSRRHRKSKEPPDLDITAFLNLMVVLVPFLLVSAVFSRITILELNMPTAAGSSKPQKAKLNIEVIIRASRMEVGDGRRVIARFPMVPGIIKEGETERTENVYDIKRLSDYLQKLKKSYPDKTDATVLMEPNIEYRYLVAVMDAVRVAEIPKAGAENTEGQPAIDRVTLFPDISIGDAP